MGTVADVNYGFKGQVTSAQTPLVLGIGARYAVVGSGLKASAGGAGDRAVTVSPGSAWGDGVLSTWSTSGVVNAAANSTGATRWDTLVIRRHWQPASSPTGTSTLMLLTGGSSKAIAVSRKTDRGVTDSDQPIALVPIANGSAVAGQPVDLRCWTGAGGGLVAQNLEALQYLDDKGTRVKIGKVTHSRLENGSGDLYWDHSLEAFPDVDDQYSIVASGNVTTNGNGDATFNLPYGGFPTSLAAAFIQDAAVSLDPLGQITFRFNPSGSTRTSVAFRVFGNTGRLAAFTTRVFIHAVGR